MLQLAKLSQDQLHRVALHGMRACFLEQILSLGYLEHTLIEHIDRLLDEAKLLAQSVVLLIFRRPFCPCDSNKGDTATLCSRALLSLRISAHRILATFAGLLLGLVLVHG